jgi:hypothetical protein
VCFFFFFDFIAFMIGTILGAHFPLDDGHEAWASGWEGLLFLLFVIPFAFWGWVISGVLMDNWEGYGHVFCDKLRGCNAIDHV